MTHYTVMVQIPKDEIETWEEYVNEVLAPYDENIVVAPYIKWSPDIARKDLAERIADLRKKVESNDFKLYNIDYCKKELARLEKQTSDEYFKEDIKFYEKDKIDKDGNGLSIYNPNSKWDWYETGGRWEGGLKSKTGENVNKLRVRDLDLKRYTKKDPFSTFAVITKNGVWHEPARMGWWAVTHDETEPEDVWESKFVKRFVKPLDPEDWIVLVDCHI
jgi:hypothetical protein